MKSCSYSVLLVSGICRKQVLPLFSTGRDVLNDMNGDGHLKQCRKSISGIYNLLLMQVIFSHEKIPE